jgi:hypothetical protein
MMKSINLGAPLTINKACTPTFEEYRLFVRSYSRNR